MAELGARKGFGVTRPVALNRFEDSRLYNYTALTDLPFPGDQTATVFFDADTGAFHADMGTDAGHTGNTITNWLRALHMIVDPVNYLAYRIFVVVVGVVVAMLSITGVYIWWRKRAARLARLSHSTSHGLGAMAAPLAQIKERR